jgi:hypothetical protein
VGTRRELEVLVSRQRPAVVLRTDVVLSLRTGQLALGVLGELVEAHLRREWLGCRGMADVVRIAGLQDSSPSRFSERRAIRPDLMHLRLAPSGGDVRRARRADAGHRQTVGVSKPESTQAWAVPSDRCFRPAASIST